MTAGLRVYDESVAPDTANLPEPEVLATDIVEDLESALEQFRLMAEDLGEWGGLCSDQAVEGMSHLAGNREG